jgi:hypothetical protein
MKPDAIVEYIIYALGIIAILLAVLVLQGCEINMSVNNGMTNDEIISEVKKCNDAGLLGQVIFDRRRQNVIKVQCITKIKESVAGPVISSEA